MRHPAISASFAALTFCVFAKAGAAAEPLRPRAAPVDRTPALYVALRGGGSVLFDQSSLGPGLDVLADYELGYFAAAAAGIDPFGPFRGEFEIAIRENDADEVLRNDQEIFGGDAEAVSYMLNGYLDLGVRRRLAAYRRGGYRAAARLPRPFVGVGVGAARVAQETNAALFDSGEPFAEILLDDADTAFAYQLIGGVTFPITPNLAVQTDVRYFSVVGLEFDRATFIEPLDTVNTGVFDTEYDSFTFSAGVSFKF